MTEQPIDPKTNQKPTTPKIPMHLIKVCPECAGPVLRGSSCMACAHCGWGRCQ